MERDENRFHGPQQCDRANDHHGRPDDHVRPHGRLDEALEGEDEGDHDRAQYEDDENRGPVARIVRREIEVARDAALGDAEQTVEQLTPSAARAA